MFLISLLCDKFIIFSFNKSFEKFILFFKKVSFSIKEIEIIKKDDKYKKYFKYLLKYFSKIINWRALWRKYKNIGKKKIVCLDGINGNLLNKFNNINIKVIDTENTIIRSFLYLLKYLKKNITTNNINIIPKNKLIWKILENIKLFIFM